MANHAKEYPGCSSIDRSSYVFLRQPRVQSTARVIQRAMLRGQISKSFRGLGLVADDIITVSSCVYLITNGKITLSFQIDNHRSESHFIYYLVVRQPNKAGGDIRHFIRSLFRLHPSQKADIIHACVSAVRTSLDQCLERSIGFLLLLLGGSLLTSYQYISTNYLY